MNKTTQTNTAPFLGIRNRLKMQRQYEELARIVETAGRFLQTDLSVQTAEALREVICAATFMMSTLSYLIQHASRSELEGHDVERLLEKAERLVLILESVFE